MKKKNKSKCKYVRREGESCTLNNNCRFPDCDHIDIPTKKIKEIE